MSKRNYIIIAIVLTAWLSGLCTGLITNWNNDGTTAETSSSNFASLASAVDRYEQARQEFYLATSELNTQKSRLTAKEVELANKQVELAKKLAEPRPKAKVVEIPVEKIVEVPVEILTQPIDWRDVNELKAFLGSDNTSEVAILKANKDGIIQFEGQCKDRAIQLINNAQAVGKRLFFVPLHPAEYLKWYGETLEVGHYHAICGALVGDDFYYVEPSDDNCWLALHLD